MASQKLNITATEHTHKTIFFKQPAVPVVSMKMKGRVSRRQCNTGDTVASTLSKLRERRLGSKKKRESGHLPPDQGVPDTLLKWTSIFRWLLVDPAPDAGPI